MASTFKRYLSRNIGTAVTSIGTYTVPGSTTTTAIGLTVSNTTLEGVKVDVSIYDGTHDTYLVKNMDIVPGQAQGLIGGDQKVVLQSGDQIRVKSSAAASVDAILSVLELT